MPCSPSAVPVRMAMRMPSEPNASWITSTTAISASAPPSPVPTLAPASEPDQEVDRGLHDAEHRHAGELCADQHRGPQRGQGQPVEKPRRDVVSERLTGHRHRPRGALDQGRRQEEGRVVVRRETLDLRRLVTGPGGDDREYEQREHDVRNDQDRLPERASDRATRERAELDAGGRGHAPASGSAVPSVATLS